jgi:hypothetical protein
MNRDVTTWTLIVAVVSAFGLGACGGDDDKPTKTTNAAGSGHASAGTSGADKGMPCGKTTCMDPDPPGDFKACCLDPFASTCGSQKAGGPCGPAQPAGDSRCPSVDIMGGGALPSCCTTDGKCGINATMFGSMGCVELGVAAEMAKSMGGGSLMWPAPKSCD